MFLLVSGRHVGAHLDGLQNGVSIQIPINLGKKFIRISCLRKISVTWILARVFVYLPSFFSQILDLTGFDSFFFLFWSILNGVTLKTSNWCINMGYWPSVRSRWLDTGKVLFCVFMDRDGAEIHKHTKKEQGQYQAILTEQSLSIKDLILLYGFRENFSCGTRQVVPSRQDSSISCPLG